MEYLDFEQPIQELEEQLQKCAVIGDESDVDVTMTCQQIEDKLLSTKKEIYGNLTRGNVFNYLDTLNVLIPWIIFRHSLERPF